MVNWRVARWFALLQDYNLRIKHVPGKLHAAADMLSRPPLDDKGEKDNWDLTLLPPHLFIRVIHEQLNSWGELTMTITKSQGEHTPIIKSWKPKYKILKGPDGLWYRIDQIVIPPDNSLKRLILRHYHNAPTAGHPGRDKTEESVAKTFWWPQMTTWIANYIRGCATCQQNKTKGPLTPLELPYTE